VDQPTEDVTTTQLTKGRRARCIASHQRHGRSLAGAAVWAVLVARVAAQDADKVLAADNQQVVEAVPADCSDLSLGDGVGVGAPGPVCG
jgi:hypothetical protein